MNSGLFVVIEKQIGIILLHQPAIPYTPYEMIPTAIHTS